MGTPKIGHEPIEMRRIEKSDKPEDMGGVMLEKPGDFYWRVSHGGTRRTLILAMPVYGNHRAWNFSQWAIGYKNLSGASWDWNGNEDKPTLTPSLHAVGLWHGSVKDGVITEA